MTAEIARRKGMLEKNIGLPMRSGLKAGDDDSSWKYYVRCLAYCDQENPTPGCYEECTNMNAPIEG